MSTYANIGTEKDHEQSQLLLNTAAQAYVKLVLAIGQHCPNYVDAYYGPQQWQQQTRKLPIPQLMEHYHLAHEQVLMAQKFKMTAPLRHRAQFLDIQLTSCQYYLQTLQGQKGNFAQEARALYDATVPKHKLEDFIPILDNIEQLLPGKGPLHQRVESFKQQFIVPENKIESLFSQAVQHAREVSCAHIPLPQEESFTIEYVNNKVWSAYNWYQGNYRSIIQLNTDLPLDLNRVMELATHEGYPGHHVFNILQEKSLVRGQNWLEYSVYPLFSPISFVAEGSANYALNLVMPDKKTGFEAEVLMKMAGISADMELYQQLLGQQKKLAHLDNLVCQQLIDGETSLELAQQQLMEYGLCSADKAKQRVQFYLQNRAYVLNYNFGEDAIATWVEQPRQELASHNMTHRWQRFSSLLARPLMASTLTKDP